MKIDIRRATLDDAALLADVGAKTFRDTFGADNTPEDMDAYLAASFGENKQAAELADPNVIFLIAEIGKSVAGFVQLHSDQRSNGVIGASPIELARIYATQEWIGRGVGTALMQASIAEARHRGHDVLWLGVWERNTHAQTFYRKWGFVQVGTHVFQLGSDAQTDFVMQKII
jgi:diamine N-acetyltransferase